MQNIRTTCTCGQQLYDAVDRCSTCAQSRQKRMSQHTYTLPVRPAKQLTPPPSQPTSPRRSMESGSRAPRQSYASEAFTNALSSEGGISFFPPSIYRSSDRRSASRTSSIRSQSSSESSNASTTPGTMSPLSEQASRKNSRSATPDPLRSAQAGYAPMAAGFARLNKKDGLASGRGSARPSLELEARMFSGPA